MTVFSCFSPTPRYLRTTGITDVATIISDLRSELVTNGSWTEPSSNLFKSPVVGAGKFLDVLFTSISTTNLEMRVRDQNAITICTRRAQIDGAGTAVQYYTDSRQFVVDIERATRENFQAGMLDLSPEDQEAHSVYIYGHGSRTAADVITSDTACNQFMLDNGAATQRQRIMVMSGSSAGGSTPAQGPEPVHGSGKNAMPQCYVQAAIGGATQRYAGRLFNNVLCPNSFAFDTEKTLVIGDNGETGVFRTVGIPTAAMALVRRMVRKS